MPACGAIPVSLRSRKRPACHLEAMECLADLTRAVHTQLSDYTKKLFDPLFSNGLAEPVRLSGGSMRSISA